jgi:hypothetical protein
MDHSKSLSKWVTALEARQVSSCVPAAEWVLQNCDWRRKLAQYRAILEGLPDPYPETRTPEREALLSRYKWYFDELDAGVAAPRWDQ